ncbi:hypothetical protein ACFWB0_05860 [Rhodococcus sp. NPDC060086]
MTFAWTASTIGNITALNIPASVGNTISSHPVVADRTPVHAR